MCTRVRIIYYSYPLYIKYTGVRIVYSYYNKKYQAFSKNIYTTNITCTNRRKKFIKSSRQLNVIFVFYRIHLFYFR